MSVEIRGLGDFSESWRKMDMARRRRDGNEEMETER